MGKAMDTPCAALEALTGRTAWGRDVAAAELGDLLRGNELHRETAVLVVARLVAFTVNEYDRGARESALNSIGEAFNHLALPLDLFTPLMPELSTMEPALLVHTLYIMGSTQDPAAAPLIRPFLHHPDATVREDAAAALTGIPHMPQP